MMTLQMYLVVSLAFAMSLAESEPHKLRADLEDDIEELWNKINDLYGQTEDCQNKIKTLSGKIGNIANRPSVDNTGLKCQSGTFAAHTFPVAPKWPVNKYIKFQVPFSKAPALTYGMYVLDSQSDTNIRALASVKQLDGRGFKLQLTTWAGTKQWGVGVSWMACPSQ